MCDWPFCVIPGRTTDADVVDLKGPREMDLQERRENAVDRRWVFGGIGKETIKLNFVSSLNY